MFPEGAWRCIPALIRRRDLHDAGTKVLRQYANDDAAVLGTAGARGIRSGGHRLAVADHVDLVQGYLVLLVEVTPDDLGAREAQVLVIGSSTGIVGVSFDLDEGTLRVGLQLADHLVEAG